MNAVADVRIGVIGLGYVGLPLAVLLGKLYPTVGFDISEERISELHAGRDSTLEVTSEQLQEAEKLICSADESALMECNFFIVTVPTPINEAKQPDLRFLHAASKTVGKFLDRGDYVVYESTVFPGATEEVCVPILEQASALTCINDQNGVAAERGFYVGYSPERINPGDKEHSVADILKVTSGSTPEAAEFIDAVYRSVIKAGTHKAKSIRVAEAAKVIENTQRDVNIALINDLALLFNRLDIDTKAVLEAAGTKWNFLSFRPGLVGGHCIGVDPYYLTYKAKSVGHHPAMILAGRRVNDGMGPYIAQRLIKTMIRNELPIRGAKVLVMGLAFKENCPDLRNTKVADIINELNSYYAEIDVYDPWVNPKDAKDEFGIDLVTEPQQASYDAIIVAVAHSQFSQMGVEMIRSFGRQNAVLFDVKYLFEPDHVDERL